MDKIKLVVIDECILGYIQPNRTWPETAGILHASILRGSTCGRLEGWIFTSHRAVRLASEKDFNDYNVSFDGYRNDPEYEYQK
jgi:hypothetical protein